MCVSSASTMAASTPVKYQDKQLFHVGNQFMLYVQKWNGKARIHLRQFDMDPKGERIYPTKMGLSFSSDEFNTFKTLTPEILQHVQNTSDQIEEEYNKLVPPSSSSSSSTEEDESLEAKKRKFFNWTELCFSEAWKSTKMTVLFDCVSFCFILSVVWCRHFYM